MALFSYRRPKRISISSSWGIGHNPNLKAPKRPIETQFVWIGFALKNGEKKTHFAQSSVPEIYGWQLGGSWDASFLEVKGILIDIFYPPRANI